jgi:hypothetical protein
VEDHAFNVLCGGRNVSIAMRHEYGVLRLATSGFHDAMVHPPGGKIVCKIQDVAKWKENKWK